MSIGGDKELAKSLFTTLGIVATFIFWMLIAGRFLKYDNFERVPPILLVVNLLFYIVTVASLVIGVFTSLLLLKRNRKWLGRYFWLACSYLFAVTALVLIIWNN